MSTPYLPHLKLQPPSGFHPDDVQVTIHFDEETGEYTHPLFAWVAKIPKVRKTFYAYRPDCRKPITPSKRNHGYRIDQNASAKTTYPNFTAFHQSIFAALSRCRGANSK